MIGFYGLKFAHGRPRKGGAPECCGCSTAYKCSCTDRICMNGGHGMPGPLQNPFLYVHNLGLSNAIIGLEVFPG